METETTGGTVELTISRPSGSTSIELTEFESHAVAFYLATGRVHATVGPIREERVDDVYAALMGEDMAKCSECGSTLPEEIEPGTGVYCGNCGHGQHVPQGGEE